MLTCISDTCCASTWRLKAHCTPPRKVRALGIWGCCCTRLLHEAPLNLALTCVVLCCALCLVCAQVALISWMKTGDNTKSDTWRR